MLNMSFTDISPCSCVSMTICSSQAKRFKSVGYYKEVVDKFMTQSKTQLLKNQQVQFFKVVPFSIYTISPTIQEQELMLVTRTL